MEKWINFGEAWPWARAYQVKDDVYMAGNSTILLVDINKRPLSIREIGWVKGKTMFAKSGTLPTQFAFCIPRRVLEAAQAGQIERLTVLDYRHKVKKTWKIDAALREPTQENEVAALVIGKPEAYAPDAAYKKFNN